MPEDAPPQAEHRHKRLPILVRHAISLGIVFALAIPASYFVGQHVYRSMQMAKLSAVEEDAFKEGLAYVNANAVRNESVRAQAIEQIDALPYDRATQLLLVVALAKAEGAPVPDGVYEPFGRLVASAPITKAFGLYQALTGIPGSDNELAGRVLLANLKAESDQDLLLAVELLEADLLWSKDQAPRAMWLRWLNMLAAAAGGDTQLKAATLLGELPNEVNNSLVVSAISKLATSKHEQVRARTLSVLAGYAQIAEDPTDYEQLIFGLGNDPNPVIARRAWMVVGHLNPFSGFAVNWKDADPYVAEAMLWAAVKTNPGNTKPAHQAYAREQTRPLSLQALAVFDDADSREMFRQAAEPPDQTPFRIDIDLLVDALAAGGAIEPTLVSHGLVSAIAYEQDQPGIAQRMIHSRIGSVQVSGALLAGLIQSEPTVITGDFKKLITARPDTTDADIRAMDRQSLAAFGLRRVDALPALLEAAENAPASANRQAEVKLLRLALWMRSDLGDDFTPTAEAMLFDEDLPTPTVLMCLLHMKRPIALDYLFGDLVTPRPNLHALFIQQRYWHVFRRFVDTTDLTLWLWGDPAAQAFQIDAMRQWYAVNRWRIAEGWWPEPTTD